MKLNEIERLDKDDYTGGKSELYYVNNPSKKKVMPLPGGSGLQYAIVPDKTNKKYISIVIVNPNHLEAKPVKGRWEYNDEYYRRLGRWNQDKENGTLKAKPQVIGKLSIYGGDQGIPGAVKVGAITVDEDYRGQGIAKALYGIVLTIMKKPLIAGSEQTPGGRRNWMSLASIPGVEVKGYVQVSIDEVTHVKQRGNAVGWNEWGIAKQDQQVDIMHDNLMKLGGQFLTKNSWSEYWAFDVMPGDGELKPAIKNQLSKLYSRNGEEPTGLVAYWTGE